MLPSDETFGTISGNGLGLCLDCSGCGFNVQSSTKTEILPRLVGPELNQMFLHSLATILGCVHTPILPLVE